MAEDFGFKIGNWNQSYQYDTLPKVITESELKTGDLIFYEGTFFSSRSKKQKHNIVHVEIFMGELGTEKESTIGARYQRGVIQVFPSFKFVSTTWALVAYHFRSLDPWLEGVCKSCCREHEWIIPDSSYIYAAGKRSIFAIHDEDEAADESEQQEDDESPNVGDKTNQENEEPPTVTLTPTNLMKEISDKSTDPITFVTKEDLIPNNVVAKADVPLPKPKAKKILSKPVNGPMTYYVGKSNGWRLVKEALDKRGWQQLPFDYRLGTPPLF